MWRSGEWRNRMRSEARTVVALFGGAAKLVLAVGCGGGTKGPSSSTTPMTTPSSSVGPAPSTAPGTGGGGTVPGGPTGGGGPGGGGGPVPGVGGGGGPGGGGGCVGNIC